MCRSSPVQKGNIGNYPYRVVDIPVPKEMDDEHESLFHLYELIHEFSPRAVINNDNIYLSNLLPYFAPEIVRVNVVHGFRPMNLSWDAHLVIFNAALVNYQYVDYIIALSTPMKEEIINRLRCPDDQVKVVFNGLIRSKCERKKAQYPGRPIQIVFGGGNNRTKGADVFFSVAKSLSRLNVGDYHITWIGHVAEKGKYSKANLNSIPHVTSSGYLSNDRLEDILTQGDILAMPSRAEGCPMLLLEAMSKGMAIVASDCPSALKEIVTAANAGSVVSVGSSRELLHALGELIKSDATRQVMSENAVKFYIKNLTMDCCGGKIEKLCGKARPSRIAKKEDFPPHSFIPYHRRPYRQGSLLKLTSLKQRIRFTFGKLPARRHIDI